MFGRVSRKKRDEEYILWLENENRILKEQLVNSMLPSKLKQILFPVVGLYRVSLEFLGTWSCTLTIPFGATAMMDVSGSGYTAESAALLAVAKAKDTKDIWRGKHCNEQKEKVSKPQG